MSTYPLELLAPAGGFEQLQAAIHYGADAVYLGGEQFGLRKRADNFSDADLAEAVAQAHASGVKVHVTVNALMHEAHVEELVPYLHLIEDTGADAIIAGDLATIALARQETPRLEIHASTQLSCANSQAALVLHQLGCKRVVLARELSLSEIAAIRRKLPFELELEVFVHGAMCMAVSGRCLISNHLTGRDANQGHCTQPCRWIYTLEEEKRPGVHFPVIEDDAGTSILSSKDLCMIEHLEDVAATGVNSIKIEGRVKSAYYVAVVTNAYRHVLDGANPAEFLAELDAISHRPYHTGFFYGQPDQTDANKEYQQTHIMCGMVLACKPQLDADATADKGAGKEVKDYVDAAIDANTNGETPKNAPCYLVTFQLRNRMDTGQTIEVLSPGKPIRSFVLSTTSCDATGFGTIANRTCDTYTTLAPFEMQPGDIMRRLRGNNELR